MAHFQEHFDPVPLVRPHLDDHGDNPLQQLDPPPMVGGASKDDQRTPPATGHNKEGTTLGHRLQLEGDIGRNGGVRSKTTKKGMRERVKEHMPGSEGGEHSHTSPTTTPGGYYATGEHNQLKGFKSKIKEWLFGPHKHGRREDP